MPELNIKRDDVVSVLNYNTQPGRHAMYLGKVLGIILPGNVEVDEHIIIIQEGDRSTDKGIKIKIKPYYRQLRNQVWHDSSVPEPIGDDLIYYERVMDIHIIKPEDYENMRFEFLTKLNIMSNLLFNYDDFRIERLVDKPKPFKR